MRPAARRALAVGLALLLAAGLAAGATSGTAFSDDFEDGDIGDYTTVQEKNVEVVNATTHDVPSGSFAFYQEVKENDTDAGDVRNRSPLISGFDANKSFNVTFELQFKKLTSSGQTNQQMLWVDDGAGRIIQVGHKSNEWKITQSAGIGTDATTSSSTSDTPGDVHTLKLEADYEDGKTRLYLNDSLVITADLTGGFNEPTNISIVLRNRVEASTGGITYGAWWDDIEVTGGGVTSGSSSSNSPPAGTYLQTFILDSHTALFNPQTTDLTAFYWDPDGDTVRAANFTAGGEWVEEGSDGFDFRNESTIRLYDGKVYRLEAVDGSSGAVHAWTGYVAEDDGVDTTLVVFGPEGGEGGTTPAPGDGTAPPGPPPLEQPEFELGDTGTFLQTGIFFFPDEGRCIGLRYYDPSGETTELHYSFEVNGTKYEDTITFDEPVGYYAECIDELAVGPDFTLPDDPLGDVEFNFTTGGETFNASAPFGAGGIEFDLAGFGDVTPGGGVLPTGGEGQGTPLWLWLIVLGLAVFAVERTRPEVIDSAQDRLLAGGRAASRRLAAMAPRLASAAESGLRAAMRALRGVRP